MNTTKDTMVFDRKELGTKFVALDDRKNSLILFDTVPPKHIHGFVTEISKEYLKELIQVLSKRPELLMDKPKS